MRPGWLQVIVSGCLGFLAACADEAPELRATRILRPPAVAPLDATSARDAGPLDDAAMGDGIGEDSRPSQDGAVEDSRPQPDVAPDVGPSPDTSPDAAGDVHPAPEVGPVLYPADRIHSPLSPAVVTRLRAIASADPTLHDDVFMKVGASTSVSRNFLHCLADPDVDLGAFEALRSTRDFFADGDASGGDPFSRASLAAKSGMSARWAIQGDPPPLVIEYGAIAPRFALVHYGTNDMGLGSTYESALFPFVDNLWTLVDTLIDLGVIPILATIQRRLDRPAADLWVPLYNGAIRAIAAGRQVPLVDMWLANETLPRFGLASDGLHSSTHPDGACRFDTDGLGYGMNHRNLQTLTALSRVEAAVLDAEAAEAGAEVLAGLGSPDAPFVIPRLPFADRRDTRDAPSDAFDTYPACGSSANEAGPEFVYRLETDAAVRLRISVHDLGSTDIDLHLLDETGVPEGCLARAHQFLEVRLDPGVHHLVLDTFVSSSGVERAGEYLLVVTECPPEDTSCGE